MAPRQQHTFTLVPNPLGMQGLQSRAAAGAPQGKPPMTSKQAQKLYREANRGPRISKAEQRRIEREEQERIRRELDKEKQANKARTLREKKKAKEQQILDDKKKKGLPLVNVRPSQDTIARFVRGNGLGKKRDSAGVTVIDRLPGVQEEAEGDDESTTEDRRGNHETQESKRRRSSQHGSPGGATGTTGTDAASATAAGDTRDVQNEDLGLEKKPHENTRHAAQTGLEKDEEGRAAGHEEPTRKKTSQEMHTRPAAGSPRPSTLLPAKPIERIAQAGPVTAAHKLLAKETLANTPVSPQQQGTPAPSVPGHEKAILTTPKPAPSEADVSPVTNTTPVNKPVQSPKPSPPKSRVIPPPRPPKHLTPKLPPGQHATTRKALQETTNASNRARPVNVSASKPSFASPYKPDLVTPRRPTPAPAPTFKQARPETPTARVQKPHFLPPHLRSTTTCQRPLSPASVKKPHASCLPERLPEPPTSTQLFVMSHLDDMFPSPSQEARELQGDAPAAVVAPTKPRPDRPPFAARPAPRPKLPARQVTHVNASMAPPPRPVAAPRTASNPTETPSIPFISTQDLFFSSQDMRDLEEPIATPSRARCTRSGSNAPPFKSRSVTERPSPLSRSSHRAPVPEGRISPVCSGQPRQQAQGEGTAAPKPADITQAVAMQPTALPKPTISQKDRFPPCPGSVVAPAAPQQAPPRPTSPEKHRFFGSSGSGAEMLLALDRSRKSYEAEERKRCIGPRRITEGKEKGGQQKESLLKKVPEMAPTADLGGEPGRVILPPPGPHRPGDKPGASSQHKASQETDYGDAELDSIDFDNLGVDSLGPVAKPTADVLDNVLDDYDFNDADDMWDV